MDITKENDMAEPQTQNNCNGTGTGSPKTMQIRKLTKDECARCTVTVYPLEKIGPLSGGKVYHRECFRCRVCGATLTVKTFYHNMKAVDDQEVYCRSHQPK